MQTKMSVSSRLYLLHAGGRRLRRSRAPPSSLLLQSSKRCYSFGIPGIEVADASRDVEHTPLFCKETLHYLAPSPGKTYLDMTFGSGGHTKLLLDHCPECTVIASDADRRSFDEAAELSKK